MGKILITTVPFGLNNTYPLDLLNQTKFEYLVNPIGRKLREAELMELIPDFDVIIAGTEQISAKVLGNAKNLKLISRVGVGLDGVDLLSAQSMGIKVSYTAEAPAPAVADLTVGLMFSLLRSLHVVNLKMHRGEWDRIFGRRLSEVTIGIVGAGRIGSKVIDLLSVMTNKKILVNDDRKTKESYSNVFYVDKKELLMLSDVVSVHIPLTRESYDLIKYEELMMMKPGSVLINTSRGGIVNEKDLIKVLKSGHLAGAAIDVFEEEPYYGELLKVDNCLLTSHMGSMSEDCRARMEIEATEEAIRFLKGDPLINLVPEEEYKLRQK
jgi:D-3-phosphoglycerate dehydrogenase